MPTQDQQLCQICLPFLCLLPPCSNLIYIYDTVRNLQSGGTLISSSVHLHDFCSLFYSVNTKNVLMPAVIKVFEKPIQASALIPEDAICEHVLQSTVQSYTCRMLLCFNISVLCYVCSETFPSSISHLARFAYQIFLHASRESCGQI